MEAEQVLSKRNESKAGLIIVCVYRVQTFIGAGSIFISSTTVPCPQLFPSGWTLACKRAISLKISNPDRASELEKEEKRNRRKTKMNKEADERGP